MSEAKRLLAEATPLPWFEDTGKVGAGDTGIGEMDEPTDAALIVYAVNHLPAYEAAVEALEQLVVTLEGSTHGLFEEWPATRGAVQAEGILIADLEPDLYQASEALRRLREDPS